VERMYLDTDCILALIKEEDWLKNDVSYRVRNEGNLCTSVLTIIECQLVLSREDCREAMYDMIERFDEEKIRIIALDREIECLSNLLMKKYPLLGIFDSVHAATCIKEEETLLSTDHIYPLITELISEDPRF